MKKPAASVKKEERGRAVRPKNTLKLEMKKKAFIRPKNSQTHRQQGKEKEGVEEARSPEPSNEEGLERSEKGKTVGQRPRKKKTSRTYKETVKQKGDSPSSSRNKKFGTPGTKENIKSKLND